MDSDNEQDDYNTHLHKDDNNDNHDDGSSDGMNIPSDSDDDLDFIGSKRKNQSKEERNSAKIYGVFATNDNDDFGEGQPKHLHFWGPQ